MLPHDIPQESIYVAEAEAPCYPCLLNIMYSAIEVEKPEVEEMNESCSRAGNDNWGFSSRGMVGSGEGDSSTWVDQRKCRNQVPPNHVRSGHMGVWPWTGPKFDSTSVVPGRQLVLGSGSGSRSSDATRSSFSTNAAHDSGYASSWSSMGYKGQDIFHHHGGYGRNPGIIGQATSPDSAGYYTPNGMPVHPYEPTNTYPPQAQEYQIRIPHTHARPQLRSNSTTAAVYPSYNNKKQVRFSLGEEDFKRTPKGHVDFGVIGDHRTPTHSRRSSETNDPNENGGVALN